MPRDASSGIYKYGTDDLAYGTAAVIAKGLVMSNISAYERVYKNFIVQIQ